MPLPKIFLKRKMGTPAMTRDLLSSLGSHPAPGILLDASKSESGKSTELKNGAVSCFLRCLLAGCLVWTQLITPHVGNSHWLHWELCLSKDFGAGLLDGRWQDRTQSRGCQTAVPGMIFNSKSQGAL